MSVNQEQVRTREEYKRAKTEEVTKKSDSKVSGKESNVSVQKKVKTEAAPTTFKRIRIRVLPIWLRLVLLVVFIFASVIGGAVVGYGMLGGGKTADVFKMSTWTHIRDLVDKGKKEEGK